MWPYFAMVGVPMFLSALGHSTNLNQKNLNYKFNKSVINAFFFIWLVLLCFRSITVGIDLYNYRDMFMRFSGYSLRQIFSFSKETEIEIGYVLLSKFTSLFTSNFHWQIIIVAIISVVPIWKMYKADDSIFPFLTIVLFLNLGLFSIYFSALRQVLAMTFCVPVYKYTKEKRFLLCMLMVACAFLFHKSAIVLLLFYPIYHLRLKKQWHFFFILPIVAILYIFRSTIFNVLVALLEEVSDRYSGSAGSTGAYSMFLLLLILTAFAFFIPDHSNTDAETVGLRNILVLSLIIQIFAGVHSLAMRMNYYYLIFIPLLIPKIIQGSSEKNRSLIRLALLVMLSFFTFFYFYKAYTDADILQVYPYIPFWRTT